MFSCGPVEGGRGQCGALFHALVQSPDWIHSIAQSARSRGAVCGQRAHGGRGCVEGRSFKTEKAFSVTTSPHAHSGVSWKMSKPWACGSVPRCFGALGEAPRGGHECGPGSIVADGSFRWSLVSWSPAPARSGLRVVLSSLTFARVCVYGGMTGTFCGILVSPPTHRAFFARAPALSFPEVSENTAVDGSTCAGRLPRFVLWRAAPVRLRLVFRQAVTPPG